MEAMSEGVATVSEQGVVSYCNARFAEIVGAPLERTLGSPICALVLQADRAAFHELMAAAATGRCERELWLQAPESSVPAHGATRPWVILAVDGARTHCPVVTDLTEQRHQSAGIAAERLQMQTRLLLADRMSSLGTLAAGVAHEINNPLASVLTSLELMSARLLDPARHSTWRRSSVVRSNGRSATARGARAAHRSWPEGISSRADDESMGLVDPRRTLDAAGRRAAMSSEIRLQKARLRGGLRRSARHLGQRGAPRAGVRQPTRQRDPGHSRGRGRAATRSASRVARTDEAVASASSKVRDTGTGIQPGDLGLVFDPFFTTRPLNTGTGLGLAS